MRRSRFPGPGLVLAGMLAVAAVCVQGFAPEPTLAAGPVVVDGRALAVGRTLAAADDDIPGIPLSMGSSVSQTVSAGDVHDVYALTLAEGEEVHLQCDPGTAGGPAGVFHLLVPGATTVGDPRLYDEMAYNLIAGYPSRHWADFDYIPAMSGTYYLWVEWAAGTLEYKLSVTRTSRAALDPALDADDIPGTPVAFGTVTGIVSTLADPDDVYSLPLTAGEPVTIRLLPLAPYNNTSSALAYLTLLDPHTPSLSNYYGHALLLDLAENSKDAGSRQTAEIRYTPTETGTHFVRVQAGNMLHVSNFAYRLRISPGDGSSGPSDFPDVAGSPYATAIYDLTDRGIISGFDDGTFRPNDPVSRQQFAKMIARTLGLAVTGSETCPFGDVAKNSDPDDPFYPDKYVAVCAAHGITEGKTAVTFDPYGSVLRQQLVSMVARAANLPDPSADYVPGFTAGQFYPTEHYLNARKAAHAGLLGGLQGLGSTYDFLAPSTRGECAQLLYDLLGTL